MTTEENQGSSDTGLTAQELREQAAQIQRLARRRFVPADTGLAPYQQILSVALLVVVMGTALFLLVSGDSRRMLIQESASGWLTAFQAAPKTYRLPLPPPPVSQSGITFSSSEPVPEPSVPVGQGVWETGVPPASAQQEKPFEAPAKTASWKQAFERLTHESETVGKLTRGEVEGLVFQDWEPIRAQPPSYSFRLNMLRESDGAVVPFAWSLDVSSGATRPENQVARDLFFRLRRSPKAEDQNGTSS